MQIAPLSATFSITTWRAIKCNADTGSETFSPSYLSPCRIAINFKYEILLLCIFIRIAIDSRQVAIMRHAVSNEIRVECRITASM